VRSDSLSTQSALATEIVQPFFVRFRRDDLHVMAFFVGHRQYEAAQAVIKNRFDGQSPIRAIFTCHNQSQMDHINDEALAAELRGAQGEVSDRLIALATEQRNRRPRVRIDFESLSGEQLVLDLTAVRPPDPRTVA
jgi:hypothetical protein